MSHNKVKIGSATPDRVSDLSVALGDLNNVSESNLQNGDYLIYDNSQWTNTTSSPDYNGVIFVGEGASQNYSASGASGVSVGDDIEFYSSSITNTISGATITSSSGWVSSITLPSGYFKLYAVVGLELTNSSGLLEYRWKSSTLIGTTGNCGYTDDLVGNPAVAVVNSGTYTLEIITSTNVIAKASQTNRHSQRGYILIERIRA